MSNPNPHIYLTPEEHSHGGAIAAVLLIALGLIEGLVAGWG